MAKSVAIVAGSYHKDKVEKMVEMVKSMSSENNLLIEEISWVPGSMELPLQVKRLLLRESIEGVIVLAIIEKGETDHGLVMGQAVTKSIIDLHLLSMILLLILDMIKRRFMLEYLLKKSRKFYQKLLLLHLLMRTI